MPHPQDDPKRPALAADRDWWRGAVIYQIYPRSYQDSNGDGIGDLKGIIGRLPYIASLGADAIWISPFFKSPMKDFGYDVSDYCDVDPMFGTLADFDALVAEAHRLGLEGDDRPGASRTQPTSIPGSRRAASSRDNAEGRLVRLGRRQAGRHAAQQLAVDLRRLGLAVGYAPAAILSAQFPGRAARSQFPQSRRAGRAARQSPASGWSAASTASASTPSISTSTRPGLEDNPPLPPRASATTQIAPAVNPYNYQDHLYDKSRPENLDFLERFRALLDEYPATAAVGEVGDAQRGLRSGGRLHRRRRPRAHVLFVRFPRRPKRSARQRCARCWKRSAGSPATAGRAGPFPTTTSCGHASRWGAGEADQTAYLKVISALLMSLRGSVCIYQGEELGLGEADLHSRTCRIPTASASGRNSRAATVAARRWCGKGGAEWRLLDGKALAAGAGRAPVAGGQRAAGRRQLAARALPPLPRLPPQPSGARQGRYRLPRRRRRHCRLHAPQGNEQIVCAFNLGAKPAVSRSRRPIQLQPLDGTRVFGPSAAAGAIRLGGYGAWFGRIA